MNKFDVSVLLSRKLDKKYQNGFNIKTNNKLPQLVLIKKDEMSGRIYSYAHYHNIVINNLVDILQ
jgi:hypothetical protein